VAVLEETVRDMENFYDEDAISKGTHMNFLDGKIEDNLDKNFHLFAEIDASVTMLGDKACTLLVSGCQLIRRR
jgi:hypothetical protein